MSASSVLVDARTRAELSQRALAEMAGTAQSVVARIENGQTSPTWETLSKLVEAAGLILEARVRTAAQRTVLDEREVARLLDLTPRERIADAEVKHPTGPGSRIQVHLDAPRLISSLARAGVRHVLVGAIAARLYGATRETAAMDIVASLEAGNTDHLLLALRELGARLYVEGIPDGVVFDLSARTLEHASAWFLTTTAGRIDIRFNPSGVEGYAALSTHAERFWIGEVPVAVASLDDLVRMKDAVDRPSDRADIEDLRVLRARRAKP